MKKNTFQDFLYKKQSEWDTPMSIEFPPIFSETFQSTKSGPKKKCPLITGKEVFDIFFKSFLSTLIIELNTILIDTMSLRQFYKSDFYPITEVTWYIWLLIWIKMKFYLIYILDQV